MPLLFIVFNSFRTLLMLQKVIHAKQEVLQARVEWKKKYAFNAFKALYIIIWTFSYIQGLQSLLRICTTLIGSLLKPLTGFYTVCPRAKAGNIIINHTQIELRRRI